MNRIIKHAPVPINMEYLFWLFRTNLLWICFSLPIVVKNAADMFLTTDSSLD